jgi:hypothetical protein
MEIVDTAKRLGEHKKKTGAGLSGPNPGKCDLGRILPYGK